MGDKIKTAIEIAMEKAEAIGDLSEEEKEKLEIEKKIAPVIASFFKGKSGPEDLYKRLKGLKSCVLLEAQSRIAESLTLGTEAEEIDRRGKGIIAIESLKGQPNISIIEQYTNEMSNIKNSFEEEKKQAYQSLKMQIEQNPKARLREIQRGQKKVTVQLSVEEAINQNPQYKRFQLESEKKYSKQFKVFIENLKGHLSSD